MKTIKQISLLLCGILLCQCSSWGEYEIPDQTSLKATTNAATKVGVASAELSLTVTSDKMVNPSDDFTKAGFYLSSNGDMSGAQLIPASGGTTQSAVATGLTAQTLYYFQGFIEDRFGNQIKGEVLSFTTTKGYKDPSEYRNLWEVYSNSKFPGASTPFRNGFASNNYIYMWVQDYVSGSYLTSMWRYYPKTDFWEQRDVASSNAVCASAYWKDEKGFFIEFKTRTSAAIKDVYELWLYDGQNNSWTQLANFPSMMGGEQNNHLMFVNNSQLYLRDYKGVLWNYDLVKNNWSTIPSFSNYPGIAERYMASFGNRQTVLVGLGHNDNYVIQTDLWEYDISLLQWTKRADFPGKITKEFRNWTCFEINSNVYFIASYRRMVGEQTSWIYDIQKDSWRFIDDNANLPFESNTDGQSFNIGNDVFVFDGSVFWKFNPYDQ